jgi:signal transduction histidine kinase
MDIRLVVVPNKDDIFLEADKGRLVQVISNLLSNAIKFTRQEEKEGDKKPWREEQAKTILIAMEKDDQKKEAIVSIRDGGVGIDPEVFPRLFSKFASKSFEGTGLGLFISKSIIEAHGGKIWAENNASENDGSRGATFRFSLALYEAHEPDIQATVKN